MSQTYKHFFSDANSKPDGISMGYPVPGPQSTSSKQISEDAFFASDHDWQDIANSAFDYIVVGTGPTGVAFIEETYRRQPDAKILVLERGEFWLPVHYQMLNQAFQATTGSPPTTYPWSRTTQMATTGHQFFQAGYMPIVGGRSSYWSAWCPAPNRELMRDWPDELIKVTEQPGFWDGAKKFLRVKNMNEVQNGVYGKLQSQMDANVQANFKGCVPSAKNAYPAPIAVDDPEWKSVKFFKYSTTGTLFNLYEQRKAMSALEEGPPLTMVDHCTLIKMLHDDQGSVIALQTSRGDIGVGNAKVILAMGAIPPATLLMNSFGDLLPNAGKRYTGHFMSHVTARVKRSAFEELNSLEIAAQYLEGTSENGLQYHVQTSAFATCDYVADSGTISREAPDAAAIATAEQFEESKDYVVFVCATLGEVDEDNPNNWIRLNQTEDQTSNISLQLTLGKRDKELWDTLDKATYENLQAIANHGDGSDVELEYWVEGADGKGAWHSERPPQAQIRLNIIVHEASQLWIGKSPEDSVVGLDYRPHGVSNVYVTGGSLFPTSGSWNPTLTMCGLAQDLARRLTSEN